MVYRAAVHRSSLDKHLLAHCRNISDIQSHHYITQLPHQVCYHCTINFNEVNVIYIRHCHSCVCHHCNHMTSSFFKDNVVSMTSICLWMPSMWHQYTWLWPQYYLWMPSMPSWHQCHHAINRLVDAISMTSI